MKLDIQVITCKSYDTEPSVLISAGSDKYLFNSPDLCYRALQQNKVKFSSISCICNTSLASSSYSGFLGIFYQMLYEIQGIKFSVLTSPEVYQLMKKQTVVDGDASHVPQLIESFEKGEITIKRIQLKNSSCFVFEDDPSKDPTPPKFILDINKAVALGVPKGPMLKKLKDQESITLSDGKVITPDMVKKDEEAPKVTKIMVVECTDISDLELLPDVHDFDTVVHFSGNELLRNESYIAHFKDVKHNLGFFMDGRISFYKTHEVYEASRKKFAGFESLAIGGPAPESETKPYECYPHGTIISISPKYSVKSEYKIPKIPTYMPKEIKPFEKIAIDIYGTNAGVISTVMVLTNHGNLVLDAGPGFVYRIRRKYGIELGNEIIKNTVGIWTSHYHWDHIGGIQAFVQERAALTDREIPLYSDKNVIEDLELLQKLHGDNYHLQLHVRSDEEFKFADGDFSMTLSSCPVFHCENSRGCVVDFKFGEEKLRLAYSGDHCIYDGFIDFVKNADILIHEATKGTIYEPEHEKELGHSSIPSAETAGDKLDVKLNVITHISKRFFNKQLSSSNPRVMFAFEFITITPEAIDDLKKAYSTVIWN